MAEIALIGPRPDEASQLPRKAHLLTPEGCVEEALALARKLGRLYVSIDKDVLVNSCTAWGSGWLPEATLLGLLNALPQACQVVGADVCGEVLPLGPWPNCAELSCIRRNEEINLHIWRALCKGAERPAPKESGPFVAPHRKRWHIDQPPAPSPE